MEKIINTIFKPASEQIISCSKEMLPNVSMTLLRLVCPSERSEESLLKTTGFYKEIPPDVNSSQPSEGGSLPSGRGIVFLNRAKRSEESLLIADSHQLIAFRKDIRLSIVLFTLYILQSIAFNT